LCRGELCKGVVGLKRSALHRLGDTAQCGRCEELFIVDGEAKKAVKQKGAVLEAFIIAILVLKVAQYSLPGLYGAKRSDVSTSVTFTPQFLRGAR